MSSQDQTLQERYGATRRPASRTAALVAVGLVVLAFLGWVVWAAMFHGDPKVSSELQSFEVPSEHEATATVQVWLDADALDGDEATCTVRALAYDHSVVGEQAFTPDDGRNQVSIRTDRKAAAVEMVGCTAPGQSRPR